MAMWVGGWWPASLNAVRQPREWKSGLYVWRRTFVSLRSFQKKGVGGVRKPGMIVWDSITDNWAFYTVFFRTRIFFFLNDASNHTREHPHQTCNCIHWNASHSFLQNIHITLKTPAAVLRVVCIIYIYRNRRGVLGKSWGLSCGKSKVIFLKFSRHIRTAIRPQSIFPGETPEAMWF